MQKFKSRFWRLSKGKGDMGQEVLIEASKIRFIENGVCAPRGVKASGIATGIKSNKNKRDMSLIFSEQPALGVAVYTKNLVKGAPLIVTADHLDNGLCQAILCNSGNANTCTKDGVEVADKSCQLLGKALGISSGDIIVASTGVIGVPLSIEPFEKGIPHLVECLSKEGSEVAAQGILTTDTRTKETALEFKIGEKTCKIGGMAKGSGMIHPNMATMLCFITTDVKISIDMMKKALKSAVDLSFHQISVDGDTSTNDMVVLMANGMAENPDIAGEGEDYDVFIKALNQVAVKLAQDIAWDGEGASKGITCSVKGAETSELARRLAKAVIQSSLVKAAIFGADANWGRVLCALGSVEEAKGLEGADLWFASEKARVMVCEGGCSKTFDEAAARMILEESKVTIEVKLDVGKESGLAWGCDLTYDYVKINGDYRT
jgi:glutamate N-acetyltransferase/amino-acid N-acetyltransferase